MGYAGLLAVPQYVSQAACNSFKAQGQSCSGPGWYPSFDAMLPRTDVKAMYCGVAQMNPTHFLSTVGAPGGSCRTI